MENKLKGLKQNKKLHKVLCGLRNIVGEAIIAGLAIAYVAEHINQIPHRAALGVSALAIGLVLYFARANQVK